MSVACLWQDDTEFFDHFMAGFGANCSSTRQLKVEQRRSHQYASPWWHIWNAAMIQDGPFRQAALNAAYLAWKRRKVAT